MDYYVVLGIAEDADQESIRTAFRALARRYHPDAGAGSSSAEFQRAREAYETLADPERRRSYDRQLRASRAHPVVASEPIVRAPSPEPLFDPRFDPRRRASFGIANAWMGSVEVPPYEDVVEPLFATFDDPWFRRLRRR